MSSIIVTTLVCCTLVFAFSGTHGVRINQLDLPNVIRNGTGPVTLVCDYELEEDYDALVVKWFYDENDQMDPYARALIYQWIPPMAPQDIGVIQGHAEYPVELLSSPRSRSAILLREVTVDMCGCYTCSVSTFSGEDAKTKRMIVYVPEKSMKISSMAYNSTHTGFVCDIEGVWPRPEVKYFIDGNQFQGELIWASELAYRDNGFRGQYRVVIEEPGDPSLVECEMTIPSTNYRKRESLLYYPPDCEFRYAESRYTMSSSSSVSLYTASAFLPLITVIK